MIDMDLKNLFSRLLGSVGTAVNYRSKPGQTPPIGDPFQIRRNLEEQSRLDQQFGSGAYGPGGADTQTLEIRNQQGQFPLAGGYAGLLEPLKGITDPDERRFVMDQIANDRALKTMLDMTQGREGRDDERALTVIKNLREQQYTDRLRSRPLEFQELVAKNLLKTVTDLPGQVVRAGRMYDQEALAALSGLGQRPAFQETIRYFS